MITRKLLTVLLLTFASISFAQSNLTISPEKPKAGDLVTIVYVPGGDISNTLKPVEGIVLTGTGNKFKAADLLLTKNGGKYTATVQTDTSNNFIAFGFSADGKWDNNFNNGFYVLLHEGDKVRKDAYFQLSTLYQFAGSYVGVERNLEKALDALDKELALYPDSRKGYLSNYYYVLNQAKKDQGPSLILKEIEVQLKSGLKEEMDYSNVEYLYNLGKYPEQSKLIGSLKKEKFPDGKWKVQEQVTAFYNEKDLAKKRAMLDDLLRKIETDKNWETYKNSANRFKSTMLMAYSEGKDWEGFRSLAADITDKAVVASAYNQAAWALQGKKENLQQAEEFSKFATDYARMEVKTPTAKKPDTRTEKQWAKDRQYTYAMFADTYGMVMYRLGKYKQGLPYAKEAAITVYNAKDAEMNNTYALLAEKSLPAKQYKKEIEQFVKDGKGTGDMKEILKRAYVKEKGSEAGFDDYIVALQKENITRMIAELKKSMLSETAPVFALNDLDGNKIDIASLKGKVVVVDFWATWCGPCKASFPGMQKMVNKYKDDPNVKFVFIDTWERGEDKRKGASDFIVSNKYSFHVLMDNDDKVVEQFKVEGIPTKFVIDKNGIIRFKSVGFDGSDEKLINELSAMIDIASTASGSTESKKAF